MKKLALMMIMSLAMIVNTQANAAMISLDLSSNQIDVGESLQVDILGSDLVGTDSFNFSLDFDTDLFAFDASSLTSDLYTSNMFALFEVNAYDGYMGFTFFDFDPITSPNFVLASFSLTGLVAGVSDFSFSGAEFNQFFTPLMVDSSSTATAQIPEPATWMLLVLALGAMVRKSYS